MVIFNSYVSHYQRVAPNNKALRKPGQLNFAHLSDPVKSQLPVAVIEKQSMIINVYMGVSENSVPLNPMVLLIIIPIKWLFHWEYNLFSDKPICVCDVSYRSGLVETYLAWVSACKEIPQMFIKFTTNTQQYIACVPHLATWPHFKRDFKTWRVFSIQQKGARMNTCGAFAILCHHYLYIYIYMYKYICICIYIYIYHDYIWLSLIIMCTHITSIVAYIKSVNSPKYWKDDLRTEHTRL